MMGISVVLCYYIKLTYIFFSWMSKCLLQTYVPVYVTNQVILSFVNSNYILFMAHRKVFMFTSVITVRNSPTVNNCNCKFKFLWYILLTTPTIHYLGFSQYSGLSWSILYIYKVYILKVVENWEEHKIARAILRLTFHH